MSSNKTFALSLAVILFFVPLFVQADSAYPIYNPQISVKGEAAKYLNGIEIRNADDTLPNPDTSLEFRSSTVIRLNLGLGDPMAKSITLQPHSSGTKFKVEQQYETSVTIMDEGPHLDLIDWEHHTSKWEEVENRNGLTFLSKEISSTEYPIVAQTQIVEAVKAKSEEWSNQGFDGGKRWIDLAKKCKGPNEYPCGVSVSKVTLRVMVIESGKWKHIQNIELKIPMGC